MACTDPKCKAQLEKYIESKVSKKTLFIAGWTFFVVIGLPVMVTGIRVWSGQESNSLRYVEKKEIACVKEKQIETDTTLRFLKTQIADIKESQNQTRVDIQKTQEDIKEILRHLRNGHGPN